MYNKDSNLIVLNYTGVIQKSSNALLEKSMMYKLKLMKDKRIKGVLVSISGVKYDDNNDALKALIKQLNTLSQTLKLPIALIDYKVEFYQVLKKETKNSRLKLFKNFNAAHLLLDPTTFKQNLCVLLYDEDVENSKKLSVELGKYGYTVRMARDANEFQTNLHAKEHDIVISHSSLNMDLNTSNVVKNQLTLSKKLISNLPVFMDTAVETLVSFTGLKAEKLSHSIKSFDAELDKDIISAVMHFSGDMDGFFCTYLSKRYRNSCYGISTW